MRALFNLPVANFSKALSSSLPSGVNGVTGAVLEPENANVYKGQTSDTLNRIDL